MKIDRIDVYSYELRYAHGEYVMSGGRAATSQTSTVVRLTSDSGLQGWGEVCPLGGSYLPAFPGGVRAALEEIGPALVGLDATSPSGLHQVMDDLLLDQRATKSVVDVAACDLLGQITQQPLSVLLGGAVNDSFPLYEAVSHGTPEAMVAHAGERRAAGIRSFQLKVGNDPLEDAARTRSVVEALGGDVRIIADANGGWDLADAVTAVRAMEDLPVHVEQPCRSMEDNILVGQRTSLPLILDECVVTLEDLHRAKHEARAVAVNLKLSRVGGVSRVALLRDAAQELGLKVCLEDTWGGDLTSAAVSHLAASTRPASLLTTSFFNDWNLEHVAGHRPRSVAGRGSAPTEPGLGVEVDEDQLEHVTSFS